MALLSIALEEFVHELERFIFHLCYLTDFEVINGNLKRAGRIHVNSPRFLEQRSLEPSLTAEKYFTRTFEEHWRFLREAQERMLTILDPKAGSESEYLRNQAVKQFIDRLDQPSEVREILRSVAIDIAYLPSGCERPRPHTGEGIGMPQSLTLYTYFFYAALGGAWSRFHTDREDPTYFSKTTPAVRLLENLFKLRAALGVKATPWQIAEAVDLEQKALSQEAASPIDINNSSQSDLRAEQPKLFPKGMAGLTTDIIDLVIRLQSGAGSGRSKNEIAREFSKENADSYLRTVRQLERTGRVLLPPNDQYKRSRKSAEKRPPRGGLRNR